MVQPSSAFFHEPAADHPGWFTWRSGHEARFNAVAMNPFIIRNEADRGVRMRKSGTELRHTNLHNNIHGPVTLALIDVDLFAAAFLVIAPQTAGAVTLDLSNQFIGTGKVGEPLDFLGEVTTETGCFVFLRGTVELGDNVIASFMGTLRKPTIQ